MRERDLLRHDPVGSDAAKAKPQSFEWMTHGVLHGGGFVAAVHHAIGALLVIARSIGVPIRLFHEFAKAPGIAFAKQITGPLPAENVARRIAPRRAAIGLIAGQEIEEQARLTERPRASTAAAPEYVAKKLLGSSASQKVGLIRR